jgi:DNA polymerase-3 subunit delta
MRGISLRADLEQAIRAGRIAPIYILYGEDSYSRQVNADELAQAIAAARGGADLNVYDMSESSVDDIVTAILTVPMFASSRVVVVRRFEEISAAQQGRIISLIAPGKDRASLQMPEGTCVIFTSNSTSLPRKAVAAAGGNLVAVEFRPAYLKDARSYAYSRAKELGVEIEPEAVELLLEFVGADYGAITQEMDKLITYLGPDKSVGRMRITVDDIRTAVGRSPTQTVFEFCDAVIGGDCSGAMRALDDLMSTERHPLSILNTLATQVRRVMSARCELDRGLTGDEAARAISRSPGKADWAARKAVGQAAKLSQADIARMISRIARADLDFKTGTMPDRLLMEVLIAEICA